MLIPDPVQRITWKTLKEKLISDFKVPDHLFMNISEAVKNFIPITQLFLKIAELVKVNCNSGGKFWKDNSQFMTNLREVILYYFYILCQQFMFTFEAKTSCVKEISAKNLTTLMKDVSTVRKTCKDKVKQLEIKDLNYRETQVLSQLKECVNKIAKEQQGDNSMKTLLIFCKELC